MANLLSNMHRKQAKCVHCISVCMLCVRVCVSSLCESNKGKRFQSVCKKIFRKFSRWQRNMQCFDKCFDSCNAKASQLCQFCPLLAISGYDNSGNCGCRTIPSRRTKCWISNRSSKQAVLQHTHTHRINCQRLVKLFKLCTNCNRVGAGGGKGTGAALKCETRAMCQSV